MREKILLTIYGLGFVFFSHAYAQHDTIGKPHYQLIDTIRLSDVYVFERAERTFPNEEARKQYLILRNRVRKVYPYAKMAADRLYVMEQTMDTMKNNRTKKTYVKRTQKYIEDRFTDELKQLSRSQGRILVKLIHRQTGRTAFNLVKELRNGWNAFWYNNTAWLYDISLKSEYNPAEVEEDYWIEEILLRAFAREELEEQDPAFLIDFEKISQERRNRRK
ncbi:MULTISPECIES: DUF4294 domain-containing protein [Capnocytophaga]|uniref:DUF4294 domain-containing protein n=1 Tax=Capnocytophaga canis TaxID=1848903 RepID=A0A0B7IEJ8_9FLAO|nr:MULTISPECIES: DUF4294 domain-containing protein [Capnocytophaga]ATA72357.1 DUF4294 domain-containing protein [Capnocytophaga sp. H4358]RIY37770.1 DUF4294 domain-containing protein [Capnocytophaga canis]CEN45822.1 conserved exported hypothetical protein [Capnocytophaga canis]CEN47305.1 conserved exported hypothetical protein [Capnocytophaga canis]CEN50336.1 conserved exported hypothetical protein [Capnocytophaga canis]